MVSIDALRTKRFIRGLANPMFTILSSHVRRIIYAEAIDAAIRIEASQLEQKAAREATEKPKLQGSFSGGS